MKLTDYPKHTILIHAENVSTLSAYLHEWRETAVEVYTRTTFAVEKAR
jgi:hypothetical protein